MVSPKEKNSKSVSWFGFHHPGKSSRGSVNGEKACHAGIFGLSCEYVKSRYNFATLTLANECFENYNVSQSTVCKSKTLFLTYVVDTRNMYSEIV